MIFFGMNEIPWGNFRKKCSCRMDVFPDAQSWDPRNMPEQGRISVSFLQGGAVTSGRLSGFRHGIWSPDASARISFQVCSRAEAGGTDTSRDESRLLVDAIGTRGKRALSDIQPVSRKRVFRSASSGTEI